MTEELKGVVARTDTKVAEAGVSANGSQNLVQIGPRDSLQGKLSIEGDLRISGTVEGELRASGDIAVEAGANVSALVEGRNIQVRGNVNGNVSAKRKLTISGAGRLNGDVKVARLAVEDGATLNGNVQMVAEGKDKGGEGQPHQG